LSLLGTKWVKRPYVNRTSHCCSNMKRQRHLILPFDDYHVQCIGLQIGPSMQTVVRLIIWLVIRRVNILHYSVGMYDPMQYLKSTYRISMIIFKTFSCSHNAHSTLPACANQPTAGKGLGCSGRGSSGISDATSTGCQQGIYMEHQSCLVSGLQTIDN
jgi:hypothetical protein